MEQSFAAFVRDQFGTLSAGTHEPDGEACILEAWNAYQGHAWSDNPQVARCFDIRAINDIAVPPAVRTAGMLRIMEAYAGSLDWPQARQQAVIERLVLLTVQRLIAALASLPQAVRAQCEVASTLKAARAAAEAARAAGEAAWAAEAAGAAARAAAGAEAIQIDIFERACALWCEAAQASWAEE